MFFVCLLKFQYQNQSIYCDSTLKNKRCRLPASLVPSAKLGKFDQKWQMQTKVKKKLQRAKRRIWRQHVRAERHPAGVARLSSETPLPALKTMSGEVVLWRKTEQHLCLQPTKVDLPVIVWPGTQRGQNNTQLCEIGESSPRSTLIISDRRTLACSLNILLSTLRVTSQRCVTEFSHASHEFVIVVCLCDSSWIHHMQSVILTLWK